MAADRTRAHRPGSAWALAPIVLASLSAAIPAGSAEQTPEPTAQRPAGDAPEDPYRAYQAGHFDRALEGFANAQVARPDDPALRLNLGSAHYQLEDYQAADREYARAAQAEDQRLRAEALYNLGNAAYRQGRLQESIDHYRAALEIDSADQDAKYNLEFVQRELERQEQSRPQEEPQDQQDQQQEEDRQQQQQQQQDQAEQGGSEDDQQQSAGDQSASEPRDSDGDGLPDQVEQRGRNPTDPRDPDTDDDGRSDGEEDRNGNGQVDPGESDPNVADLPPQSPGAPEQGDPSELQDPTEMTPEQAERFLQGLEEERPEGKRERGRVRRLEKDW